MSSKSYKQTIFMDNVIENRDTQNKTNEQLCHLVTSY